MSTQISVIIPCYNAEKWIYGTLVSVYSQEIPEIEVLIVDDGSTDKSAAIIQRDFPIARLIQTSNQGASRARNLGTQMSIGKFIQYLDADDLLAPDKLKTQLETLEETGADVAYCDWQKLERTSDGQYQPGEIIKREMSSPELDLFTSFWCPPAAYLFRREIVEKVKGWNENLPIIQDARFALDCALYGGRFVYTSGIKAYYRVHKSGSLSTRNSVAFVRDCFKNAIEIEEWWKENGGINQDRRKALLYVYGYVARASYEDDHPTFDEAWQALEKLSSPYVPEGPKLLALFSRLFGYRQAECLALYYRRAKKTFKAYAAKSCDGRGSLAN